MCIRGLLYWNQSKPHGIWLETAVYYSILIGGIASSEKEGNTEELTWKYTEENQRI